MPNGQVRKAILHILGTLDDKIELNRRMNETLESMARALFKSWFVDFDPVRAKAEGRQPVGMDPATAALFPNQFQDSDLGPIPEGWTVGRLADVSANTKRGIKPDEFLPDTCYVALDHIPKQSIALTDWGKAENLASGKYQFSKGDILFGKLRPYFHKVCISPVDGVCSTDILVICANSRDWFGYTLMHLSSSPLIAHVTACSTGTKMPRTNWGDVGGYAVALPPVEIARAYNTRTEPIIGRIRQNIFESQSVSALRDALLPKLLTGALPVDSASV
jgi:type I restriction enzyme S subunit